MTRNTRIGDTEYGAFFRLAEWLIIHSESTPRPEERLVRFLRTIRPGRQRVRDILAGVQVRTSRTLKPGKALANTCAILLPDWLPVSWRLASYRLSQTFSL